MKYGDRLLVVLGMGPIPAQNCHHATNSGHGFRWSWTISPYRSLGGHVWLGSGHAVDLHHPTHGYDVFTGMIFFERNIGSKKILMWFPDVFPIFLGGYCWSSTKEVLSDKAFWSPKQLRLRFPYRVPLLSTREYIILGCKLTQEGNQAVRVGHQHSKMPWSCPPNFPKKTSGGQRLNLKAIKYPPKLHCRTGKKKNLMIWVVLQCQ